MTREKEPTNVLIDSLYQNSNSPISIIPLVTPQLKILEFTLEKKILSNLRHFPLRGF